jgi:PiT family inorganic phosphate transporter
MLGAFLIIMFLAYANGANDNFKGVATLYGSGAASYRAALLWASAATAVGGIAALMLGHGLAASFSGKGLVPDDVVAQARFSLAVLLAAALTVMLATRFGFPISTTHALTGALVGAGFVASSQGVALSKLGGAFFVPLLLSPVLAIIFAMAAHPATVWLASAADRVHLVVMNAPERGSGGMGPGVVELAYAGGGVGSGSLAAARVMTAGAILDRLHYLSAGCVAFARALNDAPKIAAILLTTAWLPAPASLALVAAAMVLGGLLHSRRIADTMAHRVTRLNPAQGLSANVVTAGLVVGASALGWPVSTTHVACGTIFGMGLTNRTAQWKTILGILVAWVTTLPVAALLGVALYELFALSH